MEGEAEKGRKGTDGRVSTKRADGQTGWRAKARARGHGGMAEWFVESAQGRVLSE